MRAQSASHRISQSDGRCGTFRRIFCWHFFFHAEAPSRCKHFQSRRRPRSRLKGTIFTAQVPSTDSPANGHQCVRGRENGYGRYCTHNLRRTLPRTPPDVAGLLSARYLTAPPHETRGSCARDPMHMALHSWEHRLLGTSSWDQPIGRDPHAKELASLNQAVANFEHPLDAFEAQVG